MRVLTTVLIIIAVLILLYLWAIRTRVQYRAKRNPFFGVDYAHRGLHDNKTDAPENSMAAFKKAVKAGYGIEMDVQLTKDGIPVVFHDFTLQRVCGVEGKIIDYTYEELQQFHLLDSEETIPKFEDFLKYINGRVPLIIELKIEWMDISVCPVVDRLLRKYKGLYCIESFNPLGLLWYRRYHNEVMRGQLSDVFRKEGHKGFLYFLLENLMFNFLTRPDFIAYHHKYHKNLSRTICQKLFKCLSVAWTIRSQEELDAGKNKYDLFIFEQFIPQQREMYSPKQKKRMEKDEARNKKIDDYKKSLTTQKKR